MRKMYVMKSVPSKLSDKPAYLCSLIRVLPGCSVDSKGYIFFLLAVSKGLSDFMQGDEIFCWNQVIQYVVSDFNTVSYSKICQKYFCLISYILETDFLQ